MNNFVKSIVAGTCVAGMLFCVPTTASSLESVKVILNGKPLIYSDTPPMIVNDRTMVPLRAISEGLGMEVKWDDVNRQVIIKSNETQEVVNIGSDLIEKNVPIRGQAMASSAELRQLLKQNNPEAPDLVDLYLQIGQAYGIRGDIAFCQAAKETGWWRFGGLVKLEQNNYCGLGATGSPATGLESLNGADPNQVSYQAGVHGAIFKTPAAGVEAHIQHLYAYNTRAALPSGKKLIDPRFTLVNRGCATYWQDLDGKWAVPGNGYGQSILTNYYNKALAFNNNSGAAETTQAKLQRLERENELLRIENANLQKQMKMKI